MGWDILGLGAAASAAANYFGTQQTNSSNRDMAREQMAFQERMSSSAYQRAVGDMRAAGINPMMAYSQGGASSPPGATAQMQNSIGNSFNSSMDYARFRAELSNLKDTNRQIKALTRKALVDTDLTAQSARGQYIQNQLLESQVPGARIESQIDSSKSGEFSRLLNRFNPFTNSATNAYKNLRK